MYEKLPGLVNRVLNKSGRFQNLILIILCFKFFLNALSVVVSIFHSYQPDFRCDDLDINQCNSNGTCPDGYDFFTEEQTIVSEWSLVCSRRLLAPTVNTLYFLGSMFTVGFGSSIADWFGRKRVLLFCVYMDVICFVGSSFASKLEWFIAIRVFQGFCNQVSVVVVYPLTIEYCPPKHRTMVGLGFQLMWATGLIYLGFAAYSLKDWRNLQLLLAIPGLLTLAWSWIIPESIQWLCAKQKHDQAFELLVEIAKRNGSYHEIEEEHRHWVENNKKEKFVNEVNHSDINKDITSVNSWYINRTIFSTPFLRKHLLIMSATWFIVTLSYYSVLFCMPALTSDRHLNFLIGAVVEFCVFFGMYFVLSRFGRQRPMMIFFIVNGIIVGLIGWLASLPQNEWYMMASTLVSRSVSASLYYALQLYTVELFPVVNQTFAMAICVFAKQIGNMIAPMVLPLFDVSPMLPMWTLGFLSILTGTGYIFLPETLNIQIPNSVEEAKVIWK